MGECPPLADVQASAKGDGAGQPGSTQHAVRPHTYGESAEWPDGGGGFNFRKVATNGTRDSSAGKLAVHPPQRRLERRLEHSREVNFDRSEEIIREHIAVIAHLCASLVVGRARIVRASRDQRH